MKVILPFIVCCMFYTVMQAQTQPSIRVEKENGKYGALNASLRLPLPQKAKGKNYIQPLTKPWFVQPEYDSLVIVRTDPRPWAKWGPDSVSLLIGKKGKYFSGFYAIASYLYTDPRSIGAISNLYDPIFTEKERVIGYKFGNLSKRIDSYSCALMGENGKWAVGPFSISYANSLDLSPYKYDDIEFGLVENEMLADENISKDGTWILSKNNHKYYVSSSGRIIPFLGKAKHIRTVYGMDIFIKDGKYGISREDVLLPPIYDTILVPSPDQYGVGYHNIAFAKQNNFYKLMDVVSGTMISVPIDVISYKSFFEDVFLQSSENKWYIFNGPSKKLDQTAYDYVFDNAPDRVVLLNKTKSLSYFGNAPKKIVKGEGPGVVMPSAGETYNYVLSNGLINYKNDQTGLQGMKLADGKIFVHPAFEDVFPSFKTESKTFNNPNSLPNEWLYEFTKGAISIIGSVNSETQNITGYSLCKKCDGNGFTYFETTEVVKGETKTYTTSPVQTLQSEAFDVKTGTWKKTYSNVSKQVTTTAPDKTVLNTQEIMCTVCNGNPKTNYTLKWDGKTYIATKQK